jgi:LPXTG-motif cell wall-anchored protein
MDGYCIFGDCGLGGDYTEDVSANVIKLVDPVTLPPGARQVAEDELEDKTGKKPIYKKAWFWAAVGGGVAVVGGGAYYLTRKKKA